MEKRNTKRFVYPALVFGLLFLIWMVFSGLFDPFHLSLGLISCALVTWMSSDLLFEHRDVPLRNRLRQGIRFFFYAGWLLWQVVLANFHLIKLAFGPKEALHPQFVRYETSLKNDFEKYLLANSITLTPGTVTTKIMGNTFYIHAIDDIASAGLDGEMERRITWIFSDRKSKPEEKDEI